MKHQRNIISSHCVFYMLTRAILGLGMLLLPGGLYAQSLYLNLSRQMVMFGLVLTPTRLRRWSKFMRKFPKSWGFGQVVNDGRHPNSPYA